MRIRENITNLVYLAFLLEDTDGHGHTIQTNFRHRYGFVILLGVNLKLCTSLGMSAGAIF